MVNEGLEQIVEKNEYTEKYGFYQDVEYEDFPKGLSEDVVRKISKIKGEPDWMLEKRLTALKIFNSKPTPKWGADLGTINYDDYYYFMTPKARESRKWEDVPQDIKQTFDKLGVPEAERKFFSGAEAQFDSSVVYSHINEELEKLGIVFTDTDTAVKKYPELMKKYWGKVIPPADNKFAALNTATWSGGCLTEDTFIFTSNPGGKAIKDIDEGDMVFSLTEDNKIVPAKVSAKIYSGNKEVFEFRVAGRTLRATKNHKFLTLVNKGKSWHKIWKSLGELEEGSIIAISKKLPDYGKPYKLPGLEHYDRNTHHEKHISIKETNNDLMWFLGILLGDGNVYFPNKDMCFVNVALPLTDPTRNEALRVVKEIFNIDVKTQNKVSFTIHSKALGNWIEKLGFAGKAKTKSLPRWVFGLPKEQRLALIGGLLDSDGYVDSNAGNVVRFELANKQLIEQIKLLALSCGLFSDGKILQRKRRPAFFKKEMRNINSGTSYSCRLTGAVNEIGFRSSKIREKLGRRKYTSDKYNVVDNANGKHDFRYQTSEWVGFAPIKEMRPVGNMDVYDIQVENHANFIANGVVAHNSFIYVPKGVKVPMPLNAYFRINAKNSGQFERTLIIADEGADVTYLEGCTAPVYASNSLHAAVVELVALENAHIRYVTIQNWSKNVYNLVTQRAHVAKGGRVEWIDANIGSRINMKYPSIFLQGEGAKGEVLSIALAGDGQVQDSGGKIYHLASNTTSKIISKSVSKGSGVTTFRGLLHVAKDAENVKSHVSCDALLLDENAKTNTYPYNQINRSDAIISHEAKVGKISDDEIFYLMSRGISEDDAVAMIVLGFIDDLTKVLPVEYSLELKRLIKLDTSKGVG